MYFFFNGQSVELFGVIDTFESECKRCVGMTAANVNCFSLLFISNSKHTQLSNIMQFYVIYHIIGHSCPVQAIGFFFGVRLV